MKVKFGINGKRWRQEKQLWQFIKMLNSDGFDERLNEAFEKFIPDSKDMGGESFFRQDDDYGRRPGEPDNLGIIVYISQAYKKEGRDWDGLTKALFELTAELIKEAFEMQIFSPADKIGLFVEGHISDSSGDSLFVEYGPKYLLY
ncbi:hypothetical protein KAJ89_01160 [Candidatus Parcubacteria bacterium]|nr:hypothetical protein [Candidatus Parcubacteria bacterium]